MQREFRKNPASISFELRAKNRRSSDHSKTPKYSGSIAINTADVDVIDGELQLVFAGSGSNFYSLWDRGYNQSAGKYTTDYCLSITLGERAIRLLMSLLTEELIHDLPQKDRRRRKLEVVRAGRSKVKKH